MISDQIPLHSVQLHFEKKKIKLKRDLNRKEVPVIFVVILHFLVSTKSSMFNLLVSSFYGIHHSDIISNFRSAVKLENPT